MGNRAIITTRPHEVGVYMHTFGGRDTVAPLLKYCELQGFRPPSADCYGWARICQVLGNFFTDGLSVGVGRYDQLSCPMDNGVYVIDGWEIVGRERLWEGFEEQTGHSELEVLLLLDAGMPPEMQIRSRIFDYIKSKGTYEQEMSVFKQKYHID